MLQAILFNSIALERAIQTADMHNSFMKFFLHLSRHPEIPSRITCSYYYSCFNRQTPRERKKNLSDKFLFKAFVVRASLKTVLQRLCKRVATEIEIVCSALRNTCSQWG